jgi:hypothetical protein
MLGIGKKQPGNRLTSVRHKSESRNVPGVARMHRRGRACGDGGAEHPGDSVAESSSFDILALAAGFVLNLSHLFSYTSTEESDKLLVFNNIYRLSRALFSCPLFSYTSLDLPSFLGSPFFFVFLAP